MIKIKYLALLFLAIIIYATTFAAEYDVPKKPASIDVADIDMDGDLDIVLGHDCNQGNYWGMVTILKNNGVGEYKLIDTFQTFAYEISMQVDKVNNNECPDLIVNDYNESIPSPVFTIINDYELYQWNNIVQFCYGSITISNYITYHSQIYNLINIVFISHVNSLWGILYNDGEGQFSAPEYYDLNYNPSGLASGDLNGDDREDILVSGGGNLDLWLNYETGLEYYTISDSAFNSKVKISDIDNDGDNDIIATDWGIPGTPKRIIIYSNDGLGDFTLSYSKWIDEAMAEIFVSDLNNDSFPDVIYNVSYSYPNSDYELFHTYILFNSKDGTFQDPVNYYTGICSHKSFSEDLDGNGWNDIIILNYDFYNPPPDTGSIHILFNDGTGNFVEEPQVGVEPQQPPISEVNLFIYPNPFNNQTTINFSIKEHGFVELKIYDIKGRLVKELIKQNMEGGTYNVVWNGKDENNKQCSSGIFFYKLTADKNEIVKKMILMR